MSYTSPDQAVRTKKKSSKGLSKTFPSCPDYPESPTLVSNDGEKCVCVCGGGGVWTVHHIGVDNPRPPGPIPSRLAPLSSHRPLVAPARTATPPRSPPRHTPTLTGACTTFQPHPSPKTNRSLRHGHGDDQSDVIRTHAKLREPYVTTALRQATSLHLGRCGDEGNSSPHPRP